jgi:hypothetical protein
VPFVIKSASLASGAEGLAWAGAGPDGLIVGPSCEAQGVAPDADAGEEMTLREICEVRRIHELNRPLINFPFCDMTRRNQIAQPLRRIRVNLVVVDHLISP